jgi:hypothetical protein
MRMVGYLVAVLAYMSIAFCGVCSAETINLNNAQMTKTITDSVGVIADHFHVLEQWFGRHSTQAGNNWALTDTLGAFHVVAGTSMAFGDTVKILGSADTPYRTGMVFFDMHRCLLVACSADSLYEARIIYGATNATAAVVAKQYSTFYFKFDSANPQTSAGTPFEIKMPRLATGTKVWMQLKCVTNSATAKFLFGLHEYDQ